MSIISQAIVNSGKTAYQLFWLAYSAISDGEEHDFEEQVQRHFDQWASSGDIPSPVKTYCETLIQGNADAQSFGLVEQ